MKHALRKYLSPCGSALFMVVSTMAALTVLVTAMYMSVLSSRQVQYATFDREQAYVTSTSLAFVFLECLLSVESNSPFLSVTITWVSPVASFVTLNAALILFPSSDFFLTD